MKSKADVMKDLGKVRRRKVIIQKKTVDFDEIGNQVEVWQDWKIIWVEKNGLWGQEYYAAKAVREENTVHFTARYAQFVEEINPVGFRIMFDGNPYDIKNIDVINDEGMWVKFKVMESAADG